MQVVAQQTYSYLTTNMIGQGIVCLGAAALLFSLAVAVKRVWQRANTPRALRIKQVRHHAGEWKG